MKAIILTRYGSPDYLQLSDEPKPSPKESEVLVKVHASSVNDWDWAMTQGSPFYIRLLCGLFRPKIRIAGVDVAGQVEAIGKNVTRFKVGDAVYGDLSETGFGAFAEYACAPEAALTPKPQSMSFVQAASLPHAAALALQGLIDEGQLKAGQSVLINGAGGGVGTIGLHIAKSIGAEVTGVDHTCKLEAMQSLGFDHVIDYTQEDFTQGGPRYDLIVDTKTNRSIFKYPRALKPNGLYVTVGGTMARLLQTLFLGPLASVLSKRRIRILALKANKDMDRVNALFAAGKLEPTLDGPYPLEETAQAIALFGSGKHKGKVIIEVASV